MKILITSVLILLNPYLQAAIIEEKINYQHQGDKLTGYLYYDNININTKPLVLVVHEWWGLNDYAKNRARQLADLGYVSFAIDMYGKGKSTKHGKQAKDWMNAITKNKKNWQQRAITALNIAKQHPQVDKNKTAAIGYCFGGATVMQMAYAGADLDAVVSFHGSLIPPNEQQINTIKTAILVNNGAKDSFVNKTSIDNWQAAMNKTNSHWAFTNYANAKHAFTNPAADSYGKLNHIENLAYNKKADILSWQSMQNFLQENFK